MSNEKRLDILCFGEPMMEFNQQSDGTYLEGHGGDTSNCAISAARQGATVGSLTHLGQDAFGESFMRLWREEGIDVSTVLRNANAPTGIYFVTHSTSGHEFNYYRAGSAASLITPDDLPVPALQSTQFLHVSGITQAISQSACDAVNTAIDIVNNAGGRVSYDTNLRTRLWPLDRAKAVIHDAMSRCDVALPGIDDAEQLTGLTDPDAIVDFYLELGCELVALTLGAEGTLVATPDDRQRVAGRVVTPKDATAAGDTYDGAFLAELSRGSHPFEAARYANAAAALSTQGYGAVAPMPRRTAVEAFLEDGDP